MKWPAWAHALLKNLIIKTMKINYLNLCYVKNRMIKENLIQILNSGFT